MEYSPQNSFDRGEHNANSFPHSQTLAFHASTRECLMEYPLSCRSSPPLLRWKSLHNLNLLDFMVVPQPRPLGTSSCVDCKDNSSVSCSARTSRDNGRRLHDVRLLEKMRMTFVDELQLLHIHGLERCLQNDWNVNNLVHYTTDESESESQSRNCSMSELDCRNLLLHVQTFSRLSSKRLGLRELVSACS